MIDDEVIETIALLAEFKLALNSYLKDSIASPVRTLADGIDHNNKYANLEGNYHKYNQHYLLEAEKTNGIGKREEKALSMIARLCKNGFEKVMKENKPHAVVGPTGPKFDGVVAIGGYAGINVPAGYNKGKPFGIGFAGLRGSEPKLIEIAYSFEQATKLRRPPPLLKLI